MAVHGLSSSALFRAVHRARRAFVAAYEKFSSDLVGVPVLGSVVTRLRSVHRRAGDWARTRCATSQLSPHFAHLGAEITAVLVLGAASLTDAAVSEAAPERAPRGGVVRTTPQPGRSIPEASPSPHAATEPSERSRPRSRDMPTDGTPTSSVDARVPDVASGRVTWSPDDDQQMLVIEATATPPTQDSVHTRIRSGFKCSDAREGPTHGNPSIATGLPGARTSAYCENA